MQFPKLAVLTLLVGLAACGKEGEHWHGVLNHEGVDVEYETYYHPPGVGEKIFGGSDGLAYRIAIGGKTLDSAGNYIPDRWKDKGDFQEYPREFWAGVADIFNSIDPGEDHKEEHHWIYRALVKLRDVPRTLPADLNEHRLGLTSAPKAVSYANGDTDLTSEDEILASKKAGEEMAEYLLAHTSGEEWGSTRRVLNRGFRGQIREPGYEYKQRIELWANQIIGWNHSGTRTHTYQRLAGTGEGGWRLLHTTDACNHGDCPEKNGMRIRDTCDSGVVSDWYAVDGECEGNWMSSHLCNDDTSLQINHAQGIWTGWRCPGAKRGIVPKCGRQFK